MLKKSTKRISQDIIKTFKLQVLSRLVKASPNQDHIQLIRYLFVGGIAALVDWGIYWQLITIFSIHYIFAAFISFIFATSINYYLSANWVFIGGKFSYAKELSWVFIVSAIGLLFNQLTLLFLAELFNINVMLAKIMATGVVFVWNFTLRKYFIFSR